MGKPSKKRKWIFIIVSTLLVIGAGGYFAMDFGVAYVLKSLGSKGSVQSDTLKLGSGKDANQDLNDKDTSDAKDLSYKAEVSTDKANAVQKNIKFSEKLKVTTILFQKLGPSEIQLFFKLASGGLSVDEKRKAKVIILKKLSEKEYNSLIKIAKKYGLSEGDDYQAALIEEGLATPKPTTNPKASATPTIVKGTKKKDAKYNALVGSAKSKLDALQSKCQSTVGSLANQFLKTKNKALIARGQAALATCDGTFEGIVGKLDSQLRAAGYSNAVVQQFRTTYAGMKAAALASLMDKAQ